MNAFYRRLLVALSAVLGILVAPALMALSFVPMSDDALVIRAEGAAVVRVREPMQSFDGDRSTLYLVEVERQLFGPPLEKLEVFGLPGTFNAPNVNFMVHGIPRLGEGQRWLLLYRRNAQGLLAPTELVLGMFREAEVDGRRVYLSAAAPHGEPAKELSDGLRLRDAEGFERWLASPLSQREHSGQAGYMVELQPAEGREKFSIAQFQFGGSNPPPPGPGRWFQFDIPQSLPWTMGAPGQAGVDATALRNMVEAGLQGWVDDPGSDIFMNLQPGTGSNTLDNSGFTAKIVWNKDLGSAECLSQQNHTGPYDCNEGGVLAIGGSFAGTPAVNFMGTNYYRRSGGFICIRANTACVLNNNGGADGAELIAHEVGHVLALGHSCGDAGLPACSDPVLNDALMRPSIHRDGRGAQLGADDRAGMALVYPTANPVDIGPMLAATSPLDGSTTALGGGVVGGQVVGQISFGVSGGEGNGTTALSCSEASGTVEITSNASQPSIAVGGAVSPVGVRFVLTSAPQSGQVQCMATRQNAAQQAFTFNFTASNGDEVCAGDCIHRNGFE